MKHRKYLIFGVVLIALVMMPQSVSSRLRGAVAAILMPRGSCEAKVVYRSPATWSSALWVNVGGDQIAKDCPVVVGNSIVGVVDQVGKNQSRIRLITDSGLTPSVRVLRGGEANRELLWHLEMLKIGLGENDLISQLEDRLDVDATTLYLAKGELHGSGQPLWRGQGNALKGIGFNYDHPDRFSAGRDLRTGEPFDGKGEAAPLVQPGDLLVTTGMDGIFPEGLYVARVTEVETLREGATTYQLKAVPTAGNMDDLSKVVILPIYATR